MSSILPKGIVVNTPEISGDIQKIDREPLAIEEIAKLWKVYTTTKRRLLDPTAERLENYWWRIWGSRKRNLRGAMVARIFADISDGISFVPLRGPMNRDESGGRPTTTLTRGPGAASTTAIHSRPESDSSNGHQSSSVSKNSSTMPPPILKKTRGPSSTGPRPTARFISPHSSEGEDVGETSTTKSLGANVIVRPPTPESRVPKSEKKAETSTGPRRKAHGFVAATAAHKRRPIVNPRPNSDPRARVDDSAPSPSNNDTCGSLPEKPNQLDDIGVSQTQLSSCEQTSPPPEGRLTAKTSRKTRSVKSGQPKASLRQSLASKHEIDCRPATGSQPHGSLDGTESSNNVHLDKKNQGYTFQGEDFSKGRARLQGYQTVANKKSVQPKLAEPPSTVGGHDATAQDFKPVSRSSQSLQHGPTVRRPLKDVDTKSSISVAPTYTVVMGETSLQNDHYFETAEDESKSILGNSQGRTSGPVDQASLFAKRPVQPARSASALFSNLTHQSSDTISRSKSQLTLLLEKDRVKDKENKEGRDSASKNERY